MSIKPRYSDLIFGGRKRFELRRTSVRIDAGDVVVVYESAPTKALVGAFVVAGVRRGDANTLWRRFGKQFGVSREEYDAYFDGAPQVHAIEVGAYTRVPPVALATLRERYRGFRAPQSYMWWPAGEALLAAAGTTLQALAK